MASPRYTVPGWPSSVNGHSALTPHLTRAAGGGSVTYKDGVTGHPGTADLGLKGPGVPGNDRAAQTTAGISQSRYSQGYRPDQYWARPQARFWPGAGQPVAVASPNMMPVPAADPRGVPAVLSAAPLQRGQSQIAWLPQSVTWPAWGAS